MIFETRASDIDTFRNCPKLWEQNVLRDRKPPASPAMQFGTDAHAAMEEYGNTGLTPSYAMATEPERCAIQLTRSQDWKPCTEGVLWELDGERFRIQLDTDIWLSGQLDHADATDRSIIRVTDFKFRGSRRGCKASFELFTDTQAIVYSWYAMQRWPDAVAVDFTHASVIKNKTPLPLPPVTVRFDRYGPEMVAGISEIFADIRTMYNIAKGTEEVVDEDVGGRKCWRYGPCHLLDECRARSNKPRRVVR